MAHITVKFFGALAITAGQRELSIDLEEATLAGLLEAVNQLTGGRLVSHLYQTPDRGQLHKTNMFIIDGKEARHRAGLLTPLEDGSVVSILPPIVGGSR